MLGFAIQTFRYSHMDLFSHLGCLVCGILSFVFLIYSNTFLIFWHSHKCTFSYLYFSQLGCPSFRNYQFQFYQFCHSQQEVPSFVFPSFMSLPRKKQLMQCSILSRPILYYLSRNNSLDASGKQGKLLINPLLTRKIQKQ